MRGERLASDVGFQDEGPRLVTIRNVRQTFAEWLAFKQRCRQLGIPTHEGVRQALYDWMEETKDRKVYGIEDSISTPATRLALHVSMRKLK